MAVDFGKQVGPLPLGAWLAVVAVGGGIALYSRNSTAPVTNAEGTPLEDVSGDSGVGTGAVGGWVTTTPGTTASGDGGNTVSPILDNMEWGRRAVNLLINDGYDAAQAQSAITKALANGEAGQLSASEWTLWRVALMKLGSPPESALVSEPNSVGNVGGGGELPSGPTQAELDAANAAAAAAQAEAARQQSAAAAAAAAARQTAINFAGWLASLAKGWSGAQANTAIAALRAGGMGAQVNAAVAQGMAARRTEYLNDHPNFKAVVGNVAQRRKFLNEHPAMKQAWLALDGAW